MGICTDDDQDGQMGSYGVIYRPARPVLVTFNLLAHLPHLLLTLGDLAPNQRSDTHTHTY